MTIATTHSILTAALVIAALAPAAARADEPKVRVAFGAGVTAGSLDGATMLGGSVGYRFAKNFAFDVDVAGSGAAADRFANRLFDMGNFGTGVGRVGGIMFDNRRGRFGGMAPGGFAPSPSYSIVTDGSTLLTSFGFRYLIPASDTRFRPYVSGGMGLARTRETFDAIMTMLGAGTRANEEATHTGMMGTAGIGASVRLVKELSVDVNARYYRLDRGRNVGSFGGGVGYRF